MEGVTIAIRNMDVSNRPFVSIYWKADHSDIRNIVNKFNKSVKDLDIDSPLETFCTTMAKKLGATMMFHPNWFKGVERDREGHYVKTFFDEEEFNRTVAFADKYGIPLSDGSDNAECYMAISPVSINFSMEYMNLAIISEPHVKSSDF